MGLGLEQRTSCSPWHFLEGWAGNCSLRDPFSLVLNPCQGWGEMGILLDLVYLTKDMQVIPATWMCESRSPFSTGMRHPLGAMCRDPSSDGLSSWWVLSMPCCIFPAQFLPPKLSRSSLFYFSFLSRVKMNSTNCLLPVYGSS